MRNMRRKWALAMTVGLLACLLAACGGSSGPNKTEIIKANLESAISQVAGVTDVNARYAVTTGMGSTVNVRIQAAPGDASLDSVLVDSLRAFAAAADGIKTSSSVSFQVTDAELGDTITPLAVGLQQKPTVQEILDYAK